MSPLSHNSPFLWPNTNILPGPVLGGQVSDNNLYHYSVDGKCKTEHFTVIEIREHNQVFRGRTIGKIKDYLRSIYRQDLRQDSVAIEWQGSELQWSDNDFPFLEAVDGSPYRKDFQFTINSKSVKGWVGVLSKGSRGKAGFSILNADRVVRGWPESWRPEKIYGFQGVNNLINQRLVGEIHLDDFEVSHTKDDILWYGDEQEEVEKQLEKECADYMEIAKNYRKKGDTEGGPTDLEVQTAIDDLEVELSSPELGDLISIEEVPPPYAVSNALQPLIIAANNSAPAFSAKLHDVPIEILGYLLNDSSPNDPYVVVEATKESRVLIIVNIQHPHWSQLSGSEGVLNYLRHCTYDGVAEWKARRKSGNLDPDTIKILKDGMLRASLEIGWPAATVGVEQ